jgi:small subunit ribosomal protein S26e
LFLGHICQSSHYALSQIQTFFISLHLISLNLNINIKNIFSHMPVKRRNHGRNKNNRGFVKTIVCVNCGRLCPKDKAIKRFNIRDIVDASSKKDLEENRAFETYIIPKLYIKMQYCIGCGIHSRIVKVRSVTDRKNRAPPQRVQRDPTGKVVRNEEKK